MANTLRFKRGLVATIPTAALGEPLFTTDTFDLYIGNGTGNTRFQKYIASGTTSQILRGDGSLYTFPLNISSPTTGQVLKYNGTSWVNDSDAGITGSGTTNYLPKFTGASTLGNSLVFDNGSFVGINTVSSIPANANASIFFGSTDSGIIYLTRTTGADQLRFYTGGNRLGYINTASSILTLGTANYQLVFSTNDTHRARITSGGNFIINNASTDNGLRFQVTGDGYFSGSVGIGSSVLTQNSLRVTKQLTGATVYNGVLSDGQIQSDVTSAARYFMTTASQASGATLGDLNHFFANQGTISGTTTNQIGFHASSNLTSATNNYGFYGNIASGTGRWNLYMNGSASNFLSGSLGIGSATILAENLLQVARSVNGQNIVSVENANTGTGAYAEFQARNTNASNASSLRIMSMGTGYTTAGGFVQNSGVINADVNVTGGLSIMTRANAPIRFYTNGHTNERMRLDASGNLGLGTESPTYKLDVHSASVDVARFKRTESGGGARIRLENGDSNYYDIFNDGAENLTVGYNGTERIRMFTDGNIGIATGNNNAGFKLDVNGTMRVSGASTFNGNMTISKNENNITTLNISNTTAGTGSQAYARLTSDASSGVGQFGKYSSTTTAYKILTASNTYLYNATAGDIAILNDFASGSIKMAAGGSSTAHFTIASTGAATFSSSVTAGGANGFTIGAVAGVARITHGTEAANTFSFTTSSNTAASIYAGAFIPQSGTIPVNGMYLGAANQINFATNTTNRLSINSSGVLTFVGAYISLNANGYIRTDNAGVLTLQSGSSGFVIRNSGNSAYFLSIASTGAATFSSSVTANGQVTATSHLLQNGTGLFRIENTGSSAPTGATGVGLELFKSGSISYVESYNRTTSSYEQLNLRGSSINLTGAATFSSSVTCSSLVVDSTTLVVDATNNRVGVGTNVPTSSLHVVGSVTKSHTTKTANYTLTESDYTVLCDTTSGGFTISLPAASGCSGRIYVIKKITANSGLNNITIDPNGAETIDGSATYTLQCRSSVMIQSDGSNWWILAERADTICL